MNILLALIVLSVCVITIVAGLFALGSMFLHLWQYGLEPVIDSPGSAAAYLEYTLKKRKALEESK